MFSQRVESRDKHYDGVLAHLNEWSGAPESKRESLSLYVVNAIFEAFPNAEKAVNSHVPIRIFELARRKLMPLPLAPEYELHCLTCETCRRNYDLAASQGRELNGSVRNFLPGKWKTHKREDGLYRKELERALARSCHICVVAGEILTDVYDEEMCDRIDAFSRCGNKFSIVAGPMIQKESREDGASPFLNMLKRKNPNVELFVTDRRQDLHFAFSDTDGLIYFEDYHDPAAEERQSVDGSMDIDPLVEQYARDRYESTFASPDIRLYIGEEDVLLEDEDRLRYVTDKARDWGLERFGRYGLMAAKEFD